MSPTKPQDGTAEPSLLDMSVPHATYFEDRRLLLLSFGGHLHVEEGRITVQVNRVRGGPLKIAHTAPYVLLRRGIMKTTLYVHDGHKVGRIQFSPFATNRVISAITAAGLEVEHPSRYQSVDVLPWRRRQ